MIFLWTYQRRFLYSSKSSHRCCGQWTVILESPLDSSPWSPWTVIMGRSWSCWSRLAFQRMKRNKNETVFIKGINNSWCLAIIQAIHGKSFFGKKVFCNGFVLKLAGYWWELKCKTRYWPKLLMRNLCLKYRYIIIDNISKKKG